MKEVSRLGLTFDDVVLVPQYSEIVSRDDVSTRVEIAENITLEVPIIAANMDSITEVAMAIAMDRVGGLGIIHRFMNPEQIKTSVRQLVEADVKYPAISIGLNTDIEFVKHLVKQGARIICLDVAHGDHRRVEEYIKLLSPELKNKAAIIAGNVATSSGACNLRVAGANIIKVGIGGGSFCTTRVQTGCGVPQFTAICDTAGWNTIADGGIRTSGDIMKALGAGARAVMIGNLFAGTDEAASPTLYRGSASRTAQEQWKGQNPVYIEGESDRPVTSKGPVAGVVEKLMAGVRSGMSYIGAKDMEEVPKCAEFMQVTSAGYQEGLPHGAK